MDQKNKTLYVYDNSQAYGKFDRSDLIENIISIKSFSDYRVIID